MTVSFSTRAPNSDYLGFEASPDAIVAAAEKAEEVGFEAIFVNDHVVGGDDARSAPWTNVYDPFVAMSFIAARTTRIGVGVSVLIMPYRNPITTAKALATLDLMSGGRLTVGVGVGWNEAEFAALGVPFRERGARTDEYLRLWQACWTPGKVSFAAKFASLSDMHVNPKPLQQPHPPIWIGGASDAALRRAARFAAVWQPTPLPVAQLVERQGALRQACEAIGRAPIPTRMRSGSSSVRSPAMRHSPARNARRGTARRPKSRAIWRVTARRPGSRPFRSTSTATATSTSFCSRWNALCGR